MLFFVKKGRDVHFHVTQKNCYNFPPTGQNSMGGIFETYPTENNIYQGPAAMFGGNLIKMTIFIKIFYIFDIEFENVYYLFNLCFKIHFLGLLSYSSEPDDGEGYSSG